MLPPIIYGVVFVLLAPLEPLFSCASTLLPTAGSCPLPSPRFSYTAAEASALCLKLSSHARREPSSACLHPLSGTSPFPRNGCIILPLRGPAHPQSHVFAVTWELLLVANEHCGYRLLDQPF
jgi:hypothetical protein